MADVLLTHSNHLYYDRKQVRKMQPYPPLQTLLAAACLRREGYEVALFDPALAAPEQGFEQALARHRPRLVAVCEDNFNFLTKMCLLRNRELAGWMARRRAQCRRAGDRQRLRRLRPRCRIPGSRLLLRAGRRSGGEHRRSSAADPGRAELRRATNSAASRFPIRNPARSGIHRAARRSRIWIRCPCRHGI